MELTYQYDTLVAFLPLVGVAYKFPDFSLEATSQQKQNGNETIVFKVTFAPGKVEEAIWVSDGIVKALKIEQKLFFRTKTYYIVWNNELGMATQKLKERELMIKFVEASKGYLAGKPVSA
jgi:hypothetical protein